jgi:hypothetical protein
MRSVRGPDALIVEMEQPAYLIDGVQNRGLLVRGVGPAGGSTPFRH